MSNNAGFNIIEKYKNTDAAKIKEEINNIMKSLLMKEFNNRVE